jgi:hypothetical protein
MGNEEPATRVTLKQVYDLALETKEAIINLPEKVNDHEIRIRAIEKYLWIWIGAAGGAGAGVTQLITAIINK